MKDIDELRARILTAWDEMDQRIIDAAIRQWCTRLRTCIKAKGRHFEHTSSQWCVLANVTALTRPIEHMCKILSLCVCLFKRCTIKTKGTRNYDSPCIYMYDIIIKWLNFLLKLSPMLNPQCGSTVYSIFFIKANDVKAGQRLASDFFMLQFFKNNFWLLSNSLAQLSYKYKQ